MYWWYVMCNKLQNMNSLIVVWKLKMLELCVNSLRPTPNRRHFADDIFKCISENENELISPRISLKFVPKVRINNIPALVQIMAWRRPGDKPLSEPMMVSLLTHICVTRPQWVNFISLLYLHLWMFKHMQCIYASLVKLDIFSWPIYATLGQDQVKSMYNAIFHFAHSKTVLVHSKLFHTANTVECHYNAVQYSEILH